MTAQATTTSQAREIHVPGLPADVRARAFDLDADAAGLSAFISSVNLADRHDSMPTPDEIRIMWRKTPGFEPSRDALVLEDAAGWVAHLNVDGQVRGGKVVHHIEGWIRSDRRRQGIGRALLAWAERHAATLVSTRRSLEPDLAQELGFGVLQSSPAAMAFAASTDYRPIRYGFEMRRPLDEPIPDIALPNGIELRSVREEDHRKIWDADVEAFRDHWEARERDESDFVATFTYPELDTSLWRVAWEGDEVVGSVMNAIFREENEKIGVQLGWLEHVSVRRAWRGRGVAKALIVSSLLALRERGMEYGALGVDAQNPTGALALYEGLGFRPHETWINHRKPLDPAVILGESR
jgi:mycothiol synthase